MLGIRVQLAGTVWCLKRGFNNSLPQILFDRVARHARPPRDLANGHLVAQRPFPDNFQKSHVYHSTCPQPIQAGVRLHMGQFSMTISAVAGSVLSDNQQCTHLRNQRQAGLYMVNDDALKLRQSDDQCANAEKRNRVQSSATVPQFFLRWWIEYDFWLSSIMLPIQQRRGRCRLGYVTDLYVHRSKLFLFGISDFLVETTWQCFLKLMRKQCVDTTFRSGSMIWHLPQSAVAQ